MASHAPLLGEHLLEHRHGDRRACWPARSRSSRSSSAISVLQVALEARQQVVHHLVGQKHAAAVGLAAQRRAHLGFGQRLQREHMAPAEPRAQVFAQRQVHRRHAAGSRHRECRCRCARRTARKRRAGGRRRVRRSRRCTTSDQRLVAVPRAGCRRPRTSRCADPARGHGVHQRAQQVRLAAAAGTPQVRHRCAGETALAQVGQCGAVRAGHKLSKLCSGPAPIAPMASGSCFIRGRGGSPGRPRAAGAPPPRAAR